MNKELTIALIGGGNMASALAAGMIGKRCGAHDVHVVDPNPEVLENWKQKGTSVSATPDDRLRGKRVWILAVKPQHMQAAVDACRPFLERDTLVISIAAGIAAATLAKWLGQADQPFMRLVRCMPNTPALIASGATGLLALDGVSDEDRAVAEQLLRAVGEFVWVDSDRQIDAVTALSGSGPAYVFLFLEALIEGGIELGLNPDQSRKLALATVSGATQLAALSPESLAVLRERVTSKGGTTAAALDTFQAQGFTGIVKAAMQAAKHRASELANETSK